MGLNILHVGAAWRNVFVLTNFTLTVSTVVTFLCVQVVSDQEKRSVRFARNTVIPLALVAGVFFVLTVLSEPALIFKV